MDTTYTMAPTSVQGQPSFAYYPTDPTAQRQHTHYPSHPSEMQPFYGQMQAFPHHPQHHHHHQQQPQQPQPQQQQQQPQHGLPDHHQQQPLYASQPMMNMHQMATTNAFRGAMNMTPIASPQPSQLKPTIIVQPGAPALMPLDTRFVSTDYYGFPSTPPLSTSGSSISSPPSSSGAQHTPISDSFLSFEKVEGVKEGCENEVHAEILANPQWGRSESPPMTPVFIQQPSFTASQASDLLSANGSCPSLSPSPSPVSSNFDPQAHHALVSQPQSSLPVEPASSHFCDPRELTVESTVNAAASDLPPLPTLSCEEEHKSVLDGAAAAVTLPVHENPSPTFTHSSTEDALTALPTFDSFSDLDSEDEFVNRLVDFHPSGNAFFLGDKRQRVGAYGIDEDSFLSEHGLEDEDAVAQTSYSLEGATDLAHGHDHGERAEEMVSKRQRTNSRKPIKRSSTASESDDEKTVQASVNTRASNSQPTNGGHHSHAEARQVSEVSTASPADSATPPVSVNRRGRKQSLTDDPSKTFVCTLCSRRFRRQEHLKRHYRSLHTQDKPFECNECGKKFSRSDNLAQHARTHGGQSVVMGIMESSEAAHAAAYDDHDPNALGAVLYEAANAAAAKSTSSEPSEAGPSDTPAVDRRSANKKRKRDENAA